MFFGVFHYLNEYDPDNLGDAQPSSNGHNIVDIQMNAALASSVYGNSDTVQPAAIQLMPQIKF